MAFTTRHKNTGAVIYESNSVTFAAHVNAAATLGADLHEADLHEANLHEADLHEADLRWANLHGANLHGAAKVVLGLEWDVYLTNGHIRIGCESHLLAEWASFSYVEIEQMGPKALEFWAEYKDFLIRECEKITK